MQASLHTSRLLLRPVTAGDIDAVHELNSQPEADEYNTLGIPAHIGITQKIIDAWLEVQQVNPQTVYTWVIQQVATNTFIGLVGLKSGKPGYCSGEIWYKIHRDHWRKGYATEAASALLKFGFETLRLHRIEAGCATGNKASVAVLEKIGMNREGHRRKVLPIRGQWVDNYEYAILEEDFLTK